MPSHAAELLTPPPVAPPLAPSFRLQRRLHLPEDRPQDSPLFWNYLRFSHGLLTVYEVAREFEFNSLRHAVWQVGDYRCRTTKSALLTKIILYATRGGPR